MKKLLLISAMFMAMNTWGADYKVCRGDFSSDYTTTPAQNLEVCANSMLEAGYIPVGGIAATELVLYQSFYKEKANP